MAGLTDHIVHADPDQDEGQELRQRGERDVCSIQDADAKYNNITTKQQKQQWGQ